MLDRRLAAGLVSFSALFFVASATHAQTQSTFVPIAPCRIVDTRKPGAGGPINGGSTRAFNVVGVSDYSSQGGNASSCGIPGFPAAGFSEVLAVAVTIVAPAPAAKGNVLLYPSDVSPGTSSTLNFAAPTVPLSSSTGAIVPVRQDAQGGDITAKPNQTTDLVIDVTGYFRRLPIQVAFPVQYQQPNVIVGSDSNGVMNANAYAATIAGGWSNKVNTFGFVGGGGSNTASGEGSMVSGGAYNTAGGLYSTVPGGYSNVALAADSFAAGEYASAAHEGAIVFATGLGNLGQSATSFVDHRFQVFASKGVGFDFSLTPGASFFVIDPAFPGSNFVLTSTGATLSSGGVWTNNSDRAAKQSFTATSPLEVTRKVAALPISTWSYKAEGDAVRHMGPMAQDFRAAFGLGQDEKSITTIDESGVALAAIQGLYQLAERQEKEIAEERAEIRELRAELAHRAAPERVARTTRH